MTNREATIYKFNESNALTDFLAKLKSTREVHVVREKEGWTVTVDQPVTTKNIKPKITVGVALYDLYW
jgi:hypothetical protein